MSRREPTMSPTQARVLMAAVRGESMSRDDATIGADLVERGWLIRDGEQRWTLTPAGEAELVAVAAAAGE